MKNDIYIHPSAVIDEPCIIGEGTKIWHYSHIMKECIIGNNCVLGQNTMIAPYAVIGDRVHIQNNVSVYTGVVFENDVFIGPSCVFTNVINPRSFINRKNEFRRTIIRQGASIGANATIVCGNTIGKYAFIGAGAVVTKDIPAYALAYGNPARVKGYVCQCGIKLKALNNKLICPRCNKKYTLVLREE